MNSILKNKLIIAFSVILIFVLLYTFRSNLNPYFTKIKNQAAAFFAMGISVDDLVRKYVGVGGDEQKIKILLVAGHEPNYGGAEYKGLKERDLNLLLSEKIKEALSLNKKFEVITARDENGWNPDLEKYVKKNKTSIMTWVAGLKKQMSKLVSAKKLTKVSAKMGHAVASANTTAFLYGINKWANENKVDIAIHLHFNDNPKYKGQPNYEGFSIYVPESQYSNATSSKVLALDLENELTKIQKISTMEEESAGVIEDQELIALGRYNSADALSVLIEYAYIYENFMQNARLRNSYIDNAAIFTAQAVNKFFESRLGGYRRDY